MLRVESQQPSTNNDLDNAKGSEVPVLDTVIRQLGVLTDDCATLPGVLLRIRSELLALQNEHARLGLESADAEFRAEVGAARFAIAQATTAALELTQQVGRAKSHLARGQARSGEQPRGRAPGGS